MNPSLIRTALVAVGSLRRPPLGLFDESVVPMKVWPSDLDLNLHMNNGRYLTLMDLGRVDLMIRSGLWRVVVERGWRPVVGSATVRFRRPLGFMASFELHTRLVCWDAKWFFMEQRFEKDGSVCGVGLVKALLRGRGRSVPPGEVLEAMGLPPQSPPMPSGISEWVEAESKLAARDRPRRGSAPAESRP
jgi:acyl-CoA thioesterase FadM